MAEYYGVTRSPEYLMHYGVKGMKWGVRKAIASGNERRLSRQYAKAQKKLARLTAKADSNKLITKANKLEGVSKKARVAGRVGLGVAAAGTGGRLLERPLHLATINRYNKYREMINNAYDGGSSPELNAWRRTEHAKNLKEAQDSHDQLHKFGDISRKVQAGGAGLAAVGYGTALATKLRANQLRKRANDSRALSEARAEAASWQREMNKAFAGTKYAKGAQGNNNRKIKKLRFKKPNIELRSD